MKIEKKIHINASAEKVWKGLVEFKEMQKWNECLLEQKDLSTDKFEKGASSKMLIKEGNKTVWYEDELLDFNLHTYLKTELRGGSLGKSPMTIEYFIESKEGGVEVKNVIHWEPKGFLLKLMHGMITKQSEKNTEQDLENLKEYAEA